MYTIKQNDNGYYIAKQVLGGLIQIPATIGFNNKVLYFDTRESAEAFIETLQELAQYSNQLRYILSQYVYIR